MSVDATHTGVDEVSEIVEAPSGREVRRRRFARPEPFDDRAIEHLDLLEDHLRSIQLAAAAAVEDLRFEREMVAEDLGEADALRMRAVYDAVIEHDSLVAGRSEKLRRRVRMARAKRTLGSVVSKPTVSQRSEEQPPVATGPPAPPRPSEGVILLARQMSTMGAPPREIEATLQALGVDEPAAAVKRSLLYE